MSRDPYQAYPSFPTGALLQPIEPPAVQLIAAGPAKQGRLTVAFRLILVIPHLFCLFFLFIGACAVVFLGWWGALFTGRLPGFAFSYISGFVRWNTRAVGYMYLLTDVYPPFTFDDDPGYPVVIAIPERGQLNPAAVFFRFILGIWANLVMMVVTNGCNTIVILIAWLITLITGRLPAPLHLAYTAVLRYQTRCWSYYWMLTPTYPSRLFGDEPDPSAAATTAPVESAWGTPSGADATVGNDATGDWGSPRPDYGTPQPGYGTPPGYGMPQSAYGAPGGYGSAQPASPSADWPLVLPQSAKTLLIVFIVLGLITEVGSSVRNSISTENAVNSVNAQNLAVSQWNTADNTQNTKLLAYESAIQACNHNLTCASRQNADAASIMSAFASQVQAISMPSAAAPAAARVVADATKLSQDLTALSQATTAAQYNAAFSSTGLNSDLNDLQTDINDVANAFDNA